MPPEFDPAWEYFTGDPDLAAAPDRPGINLDYSQIGAFRFGRLSVVRKARSDRVVPESFPCLNCRTPFEPRRGRHGAAAHSKYCSKPCWWMHREKLIDDRLAAIPAGKCKWCGHHAPLYRHAALCRRADRRRKFCSAACADRFHARLDKKRRRDRARAGPDPA
jgi:hypothetical protein